MITTAKRQKNAKTSFTYPQIKNAPISLSIMPAAIKLITIACPLLHTLKYALKQIAPILIVYKNTEFAEHMFVLIIHTLIALHKIALILMTNVKQFNFVLILLILKSVIQL